VSDQGTRPVLGRRVLTAGLLSVPLLPALTACDGDDVVDLPGLPPIGPDPDQPLLEAALEAERAMDVRLLDAGRHEGLRRLLRRAHEVHIAHARLLSEAAGEDGEGGERGEGGSSPSAAKAPARATLEDLVRRERRLAAGHVQRAMKARSGPFARLLAVLAASATQQSVVLAQAAADLPEGRS
jgi:hypothetical protein